MISSIFEKTKPVNYIILMVFLFFFYGTVQFYLYGATLENIGILPTTLAVVVLLFTVFVVDFIIKRNKLTGTNSLGILYFTLLFILFPETLTEINVIFTNLFLLLAMRRLLSIKSLKEIKLKIFDAALWICVASLFYEWAILYLIVVFAAIYIYEAGNIRNWMVILSVAFTFFMVLYGILTLFDTTEFLTTHYRFAISFEVLNPSNWWSNIKVSLFAVVTISIAVWTFLRLQKGGVGKVTIMRLIALSFILGLLVNLLISSDNSSAVQITFFSSAIFIANYLESIKKPKILELILIVSIALPLLLFFSKVLG